MDGSLFDETFFNGTIWDGSLMDRSLSNGSLFADPLLCYVKRRGLGSGHVTLWSMGRLEKNSMGRGHTFIQTDIVPIQ